MNTEDVLPQWVRRYATASAGGGGFTGTLASGKAYNAPVPFQVTVEVGKPCNSWMGTTFEGPAKPALLPLIDGTTHTLSPADQELVGRWIAKTALMNALVTPPHPDLAVYQAFRQSGDPPPGSRALIGHYTSPGLNPSFQTRFRKVPGKAPPGTQITFLPLNAILGQLIVVYCLPLGEPAVRTVAESNGTLAQVWPPTNAAVDWPPSIGLDAACAEDAATWELA